MSHITIDFESRSTADLKKVTPWAYAATADVLMLGYNLPGSATKVWTPRDPPPQDLFDAIASGMPVEAHNTAFETALWREVCVKRLGWPNIPDEQWRCSAARAASVAHPRGLDALAKSLKLSEGKDPEGKRLIMRYCKPLKATKNRPAGYADLFAPENAADLAAFVSYCARDVEVEMEVASKLPPLSAYEQRVFLADLRMNLRGVAIDTESLSEVLSHAVEFHATLDRQFRALTGGIGAGQNAEFLSYMASLGCPLENNQKDHIAETLEAQEEIDPDSHVVKVLRLRDALSDNAFKKYATLQAITAADGRMRQTLQYGGAARTRRWSGKVFQPQNLARPVFQGEGPAYDIAVEQCLALFRAGDFDMVEMLFNIQPLEAASSLIRSMLIAGPGKELIGSDLNAIEPRVLSWLAGQTDALAEFEAGDPYKPMAAAIFGIPTPDVTKKQRSVGKIAVLGCGYAAGAGTIMDQCHKAGVEADEDFAKKIVVAYRKKNWKVVRMWRDLEDACKRVVETRQTEVVGKLVVRSVKGIHVAITLPGGGSLFYPHMSIGPHPFRVGEESLRYMGAGKTAPKAASGQTMDWQWVTTHGGVLVENVTQAVARDVMADALLRAEDAGMEPVLTVHDELVIEAAIGAFTPAQLDAVMATRPQWAPDLPLKAEGWKSKRYRK